MAMTRKLGSIIDDVVSVFSPELALRRRSFRNAYFGAYEASTPTRKDMPFGVDGRGEQLNSPERKTILKRARQAERNSDIVGAMIYAVQNNVVGSKINMQADSGDKKFDEHIEKLFHEWEHAENCDVTETQSLTEMARMIMARYLIDGGILVTYVIDKKAKFPLKIQLREVDEIADQSLAKTESGNVLTNGIELTSYGKPVAYHLLQYDPNGLADDLNTKIIPAKDVDFIWNKTRPSEYREMSQMARSIVRVNDIDDYSNAVSFKAKIDACTSVFIESDNFNTQFGRASNTPDGERITNVSGGTVNYLKPGEKAKQFSPNGQSTEFENFIVTQLRMFSASHGLSLESATRNVERVNYSSARQNMLADQQTYKALRNFLIEHFLRKLYKRFVDACYLAGLLNGVNFDPNNPQYYKAKWLTEGLPWIDPLKEANANTIQLGNGGMSFQEYCADHGADWRERIDDMAEVQKYAESKGVKLNFVMPEQNQEEQGEGDNGARK